jgi:PAS domain S-box-containing protein
MDVAESMVFPSAAVPSTDSGKRVEYARLCALMVVCAGVVVSLGWQFRVPALRGALLGSFVAPNTALMAMLFGCAFLLLQSRDVWHSSIGLTFGFFVITIAGLTIYEHITGNAVFVDRLFLPHRLADWSLAYPVGRVALPTCFAFVFAGCALFSLRGARLGWLSDLCGGAILAICYLSITGYAYGVSRLYGRVMSLPTSILLIFVGLAIFAARREGGVAELITGQEAGSVVIRRVLPPLLILLPILGVLHRRAEIAGWGDEASDAALVLTLVVLFTLVILRTSTLLNKLDVSRKKKQKELQDFFENAVVGLHWVGPDGTILWANSAELNLLGYTAKEYIGRNIADFHADEDAICDILKRLSCGQALHGYPARLKCKNGSIRHVVIHSSVLFEEDKFIHTRCFTFDVTGEYEAKEKLTVQEKALRQTEKLAVTGRMAATLAHEINNPLEAVTNLIYLLRSDQGMSPESRDYLARADEELKRMAHVARHTLAFFKGSTKEAALDLRELCDAQLSMITLRFNSKNVDVRREYRTDARAFAIDSEVRQVISNLLLNALQAAPADSTVTAIVDAREPGQIRFAVEDGGAGVPKESETRVFEPFFTTKDVGTGLGLWVSRDILQRHGGDLKLESPRNPTRFAAYFKSAEIAQRQAAGSSQPFASAD